MSNQPPTMVKGIIFSLMRTYKHQNTKKRDYHNMTIKLYKQHVTRGWSRQEIKGYILEANKKLHLPIPPTNVLPALLPTKSEVLSNKERLFLHLEYDKKDIPRKAIRALYDHHCRDTFKKLGITQMTTAFSRPKNIKDSLTKAKLHQAPGHEASKYYMGELPLC